MRDAAATLGECLASLAAQTADHEVVAVDDHATDGSAILEEAARRDPRLRVLDNPGQGLVAALNAAGKAARADLLARMDADDVCHPERLRLQAACFQAAPDLSVLGTCVRLVGESGPNEGMRAYVRWLNGLLDHEAIVRDLFVESPLAHPTVMMRAEMLARLGGYRAFDGPEDYDLWLRARGGRPFANCRRCARRRDGPGRLAHDPRYAPARFRDLKIGAGSGSARARPVVWGRARWGRMVAGLRARGHEVAAFVEVHRAGWDSASTAPCRARRGAAPPWASTRRRGLPGAREEIRRHAARLGLREGSDLIAVA